MHKEEAAPPETGLGRAVRRLNLALAAIAGAIGLLIIGIMVYGVFMRYVLREPTVYALDLPKMFFIVIIALCLSYAQMGGRHIRIDFLTSKFSGKARAVFDVIAALATLAYCAAVVWAMWERWGQTLRLGRKTLEAGLPLWPFALIIVIGMALLGLQVLYELVLLLADKRAAKAEELPAGHKEPTL